MWGRAYWYACLLVSVALFALASNYAQPQGIFNPCTIAPSSTVFGCVKPDGTTITNTAGAISTTYGTGANTAAQGNDARFGLKSCTLNTTYDLATVSGSQAITGCGFQPTTCTVHATVTGSTTYSYTTLHGISDSARVMSALYIYGADMQFGSGQFIVAADPTTANYQLAVVNSYDADGLTLGWAKTLSPVGTLSIGLLCKR